MEVWLAVLHVPADNMPQRCPETTGIKTTRVGKVLLIGNAFFHLLRPVYVVIKAPVSKPLGILIDFLHWLPTV